MIRALLAASGLSTRDLCDPLGLAESQISKRMHGAIPWRDYELMDIADFLGVPVGTLFADPLERLKTRSERSDRRLTLASSRARPDRRYKNHGPPLVTTV